MTDPLQTSRYLTRQNRSSKSVTLRLDALVTGVV